ncbi:hypothetical protein [Streptomyces sp. NPDC058475]|uniref:hypothetical protein n=1 Tax=Streptomyces sp. NPDC058475 TaxID=3346518 RepID=UPI003647C4EB
MRAKTKVAAITFAIAAGSVMISAPTASAATYCDSAGYTATGEPMQRCTKLSNGVLVNWKTYNSDNYTHIHTRYDKTGGSTVSVRLGYSMGSSTVYSSYFNISSGGSSQKDWTKFGDSACTSSVGLLNYSGGTYQTPSAHC